MADGGNLNLLLAGKKKKKKKVMVALDDDEVAAPDATAAPAEPAADEPLDFGLKKKKKKKKKGFDLEAAEAASEQEQPAQPEPEVVEAEAPAPPGPTGPAADVDYESLDTEYKLPSKKKRKKAKVAEEFADDFIGDAGGDGDSAAAAKVVDTSAWAGSDRDYMYSELLERVFDIMRAKNPHMVLGEKRRFVMKPPQVIKVGAKKSAFINFLEICKMMHRPSDHVLGYLLAELGTQGTLDGSNALVLKGKFLQKQMESVLRRYIREYVTCHTCKSPDTILSRENRLFFLTCETCGARQSVTSIKAGFSAVVGRRSRLRYAAAGN